MTVLFAGLLVVKAHGGGLHGWFNECSHRVMAQQSERSAPLTGGRRLNPVENEGQCLVRRGLRQSLQAGVHGRPSSGYAICQDGQRLGGGNNDQGFQRRAGCAPPAVLNEIAQDREDVQRIGAEMGKRIRGTRTNGVG